MLKARKFQLKEDNQLLARENEREVTVFIFEISCCKLMIS